MGALGDPGGSETLKGLEQVAVNLPADNYFNILSTPMATPV